MSEVVGGYRVEREISDDGVSRTLVGIGKDETGRDTQVLLRTARMPGEVVEDVKERFEEEARVAKTLQGGPFLDVLAYGVDGDSLFVAHRWNDGKTLTELLAASENKTLPAPVLAVIALDVVHALSTAHGKSPPLLHRAISPAAIHIGSDGRALVADFGLAGAILAASGAYSRVLQSACFYQSPEQVKARALTPASDFFSLGTVLYEALAGKRPFDAPTPLAVSLKVSMGTCAPIDSVAKDAPRPLRELVRGLLTVDAAARPNAEKVEAVLREIVGREDSARSELSKRIGPASRPSAAQF
ncbi:MAG: serine/threonine protein kinase, partial [Sandaracinaceae bacterium]|nr:serine/threonine protein kinase [Sandaracinaceae bacterium]